MVSGLKLRMIAISSAVLPIADQYKTLSWLLLNSVVINLRFLITASRKRASEAKRVFCNWGRYSQ